MTHTDAAPASITAGAVSSVMPPIATTGMLRSRASSDTVRTNASPTAS